jgi:hypothetical protein
LISRHVGIFAKPATAVCARAASAPSIRVGADALNYKDLPYTNDVNHSFVMAGLVPAIHVFAVTAKEDVDARHKAGHDA